MPLTPVPVTSKAYAAFRRNEVVYVPDFVALAAPLLAAFDADGGDPDDRIRQSIDEIKGEGPNAWLLAIGRTCRGLPVDVAGRRTLRPPARVLRRYRSTTCTEVWTQYCEKVKTNSFVLNMSRT